MRRTSAIEYALMIVIIGVAVSFAAFALSVAITDAMNQASASLNAREG